MAPQFHFLVLSMWFSCYNHACDYEVRNFKYEGCECLTHWPRNDRKIPGNMFIKNVNIEEFDMKYCQISIIDVKAFAHLTKPRRIWLNNNKIRSVVPGTFQRMSKTLECKYAWYFSNK